MLRSFLKTVAPQSEVAEDIPLQELIAELPGEVVAAARLDGLKRTIEELTGEMAA